MTQDIDVGFSFTQKNIRNLIEALRLAGHTITMELFGKSCRVLDLESLIKSKKAMGRPKDQMVVLELEAIREKLQGQ